jgi:hypothetical protein
VTQPPYQPGYQPPAYQPPGYPGAPGGYPQSSNQPQAGRGLLWSWIGFLGLGVISLAFFGAFAVQWALAASRVGVPENTTGTYGTVTAVQGSTVQVHVASGTALIERRETRVLNRTSSSTTVEHSFDSFDSTVANAPTESVGDTVSFTYTSDPANGTYLAVAPARLESAGTVPKRMVASLIIGIVLFLIGAVLLIVWLVKRHRRRSGGPARYSPPPPGYGQPQAGYGSGTPPQTYGPPPPGYVPPPPGYGAPPSSGKWPPNPQQR